MMDLELPPGLNERDALSLLIGRVAMSHVGLDRFLIELHRTLGGAGASRFISVGRPTSQLIQDCRLMLKRVGLKDEHQTLGREVLDAAGLANTDRNLVVHDMWLDVNDEPGGARSSGQWATVHKNRKTGDIRVMEGTKDLEYVARVLQQLVAASQRVVSFQLALAHLMPGGMWFADPAMKDDLDQDLKDAAGGVN